MPLQFSYRYPNDTNNREQFVKCEKRNRSFARFFFVSPLRLKRTVKNPPNREYRNKSSL